MDYGEFNYDLQNKQMFVDSFKDCMLTPISPVLYAIGATSLKLSFTMN